MCGGPFYAETKRVEAKPQENLARLMERELDLSRINPATLRLFLHAYWDRVTTLAHAIHDDK